MMSLPVIAYQSPRRGDLSGQPTQYTHPNGTRTEYEYDPSEYLTHWYANFYDDGSAILLESYTYDAMGRRTSSANGVACAYNDDDQLLAMGASVVYDYNDNGYRTDRYQGENYRTEYTYTTAGQLVGVLDYEYVNEVWVPDTDNEVTYQLDAAGRRVAKLVDNVVQEKYLWAGHNTTLLAVYGPTGTTPIARFEYGVGRMPVRMTQDSETYYFAYDQVGSLRAVFDDTGALVHEITYDSYGNIQPGETNSGLCVPFGFAGGLHDRDTGMVLFGFRDYDPETGTWLTPDPIGFDGGDTYLYGYCGGDPVNWVDADGLFWSEAGEGFLGARDGVLQILDTVIPFAEPFSDAGYYDPNAPGMRAGRVAGEIGIDAALCAVPLRPFTASAQQVVRWGGSGRWVMTGGASFRNALMAGRPIRYFTHSATVTTLPRSALKYPPGLIGKIKGLLGQRIALAGIPFFKISI